MVVLAQPLEVLERILAALGDRLDMVDLGRHEVTSLDRAKRIPPKNHQP